MRILALKLYTKSETISSPQTIPWYPKIIWKLTTPLLNKNELSGRDQGFIGYCSRQVRQRKESHMLALSWKFSVHGNVVFGFYL